MTAAGMLVVAFVGAKEGYSSVAYYDPVGIPTACFGETKDIRMGMKFTRPECESMFLDRLEEHAAGMEKCLNGVRLPDKTYVAVLSFTYNVGVGAFCASDLRKMLVAGDPGACSYLSEAKNYTTARKKIPGTSTVIRVPLKGLVIRRQEEGKLCFQGMKEG